MPEHPESFPVNALVPIPGTPMENNEVRANACSIPSTPYIRLSSARICTQPHTDNRNRTDRLAFDHYPISCRPTNSVRDGASNVLYGGSECGVHGREDVDYTM